MESNRYDRLMLDYLGDAHIETGTVYYDAAYFRALVLRLLDDKVLSKYANELKANSQGPKMCSIASSARLCYLASKTVYPGISEHEKTDVKNGICHPHYDGYDGKDNVFYEFKCHELCSTSHDKLTKSYAPLLKEVYGIEAKDPADLTFADFGIKSVKGSIYKINFDFKQFLCHVFGILSIIREGTKKPRLQYVWVVPKKSKDEELQAFIEEMKEMIGGIFAEFGEIMVSHEGRKRKIGDLVDFGLDVLDAKEIDDFLLKSIE